VVGVGGGGLGVGGWLCVSPSFDRSSLSSLFTHPLFIRFPLPQLSFFFTEGGIRKIFADGASRGG